ncbi:MAG: ECF transporter S component [Ruminococcus sp.]|nr:ECF transporter S component [Ruminococcus sp.]
MTKTTSKLITTKLTVTAMLTAIAVVLQYIEVSIPIVPSFLKLDFSDIPELIGAFVIGPIWGVAICLLKNLIHLPFSGSVGVGEFSNFILGAIFVFVAGMIYKYHKTKKGALVASIIGALAMAVLSIVTNYFIVYPVYAQLWAGGDMNVIINMYKALLPASDTLLKSLLIFNVPFTFGKGLVVAAITMFIYKPLSNMIVKMNNSFNKKNKA